MKLFLDFAPYMGLILKFRTLFILSFCFMVFCSPWVEAKKPVKVEDLAVRIKDIVSFEGIRMNHLVGYGLVVGLKGTGDTLSDSPYAEETMLSMLERLGVNVRDKGSMKSKNVAAVMVTADLPAFSRHGSHIDVSVSAIGTAKDLMGGILLVTPLVGADGEVYAVAQGSLSTGGFSADGKTGSSVTKGVPTSGRIANGAIVEREIPFELKNVKTLNLSLRNRDFTTAQRIAKKINQHMKIETAFAKDPATVTLHIPQEHQESPVSFLTEIEQLRIVPDQGAQIVIDEQNGVIVMGNNVRISTVAISYGNLNITIAENPQVIQPLPFSIGGKTRQVESSVIDVQEDKNAKMVVLEQGVTLRELVRSLNSLGIPPRDMITILHTIKAAGALQADIKVF
jgi:flagellar P-ring protein precursor FlgI